MGGLWKRLPFAFVVFLIGTCALVALPLTSGYYSKHAILAAASNAPEMGFLLGSAGVIGAFLTGVYSFRLVFIAFFGPEKTHAEEKLRFSIAGPLVILAVLSLVGALLRTPLASVFPSSADQGAQSGAIQSFIESVVSDSRHCGRLSVFLQQNPVRGNPSTGSTCTKVASILVEWLGYG